jgi:hypothetical protein
MALFVDRQHDGELRWIEIEADDVDQLLGEGWIVRTLEAARPVRLELVRVPDALAPTAARCLRPCDANGSRSASW